MLKILLIGSNFLSSALFVRLCSFNDTHVIVLDRKDPMTIMNYSQDTYNIIKKYCKNLNYRNLYDDEEFGDPKRNIKVTFKFHDYINESIDLTGVDIVVYSGAIYDSIYSRHNRKETMNVNVNGLHNILNSLEKITNGIRTDGKKPLFIHMSSINVYGDQTNHKDEEITEDSTVPNPKDLLNLSLYTQENMVKSLINTDEIDYLIFRLGTIVGEFTPRDSLVTAAVAAMLTGKKEFTVYNSQNSIELLDITDLGMLVNSLILLYKEGGEQYKKIVNQIFNIKAEERDEKTVLGVVKSIYGAVSNLPSITKEHGIKGIDGFRVKAPKVVESFSSQTPNIKFDKPVSSEKAKELLKFIPNKPLIYSLLPSTVNYLLNYVLVDFSEAERKAFAKIFYLASIPSPQVLDDNINKDVKDLVEDVKDNISKGFE
jgi:nucleoside-diphosphate-sugar epimerase